MDFQNLHNKLDFRNLHNKHKGRDCVILTCGPSLTEYNKPAIRNFLRNKIVICIKEAVLEYEDVCDYFIFNRFRVQNYNITNKNVTIIGQLNSGDPIANNKVHYTVPYDHDFKKTNLLTSRDFSRNDFRNKISRTWGPGIMLETALFLCMYMGVKNVFTIGWDNTDPKKIGSITHFSDNSPNPVYRNTRNIESLDYTKEMTLQAENIVFAYNYFKGNKMNIFVCGEMSFIDRAIPRHHLDAAA